MHAWSKRRGGFVVVDCGAMPANLVESELFVYKRGAFSGVTADKLGLFAAAAGWTLFLDEILATCRRRISGAAARAGRARELRRGRREPSRCRSTSG